MKSLAGRQAVEKEIAHPQGRHAKDGVVADRLVRLQAAETTWLSGSDPHLPGRLRRQVQGLLRRTSQRNVPLRS
jgi:hypothetical protein